MILDHLDSCEYYTSTHELFAKAFEFLHRADLASLENGKHEIDGARLYATIIRAKGAGIQKAKLEGHRQYIDIQYIVSGQDVIGWKPSLACKPPSEAYDSARDFELFSDAPIVWTPVPAKHFAVYFPHDAHAPMACDEQMHKVVVKVRVE